MKLRVTIDGEDCLLDLQATEGFTAYALQGLVTAEGKASVAEITPGVFSVLLGKRSYTVHLARTSEGLEVWAAGRRRSVSIADVRDSSAKRKKSTVTGPTEIQAQMPGKVLKLLVEPGAIVETGQGLIVVEAMKMQNEMKSPRDGRVSKIYAVEGRTVVAAEKLMVVE
ncbi:MAG: acetyl-CoA carboxylase biotin carboxyl carrier protein subunit [Acidobacteriota bacterium]|nr:acetyl-CoA carboxylase biotin carboxyl carrier protein subunit [Acidobacteriota bacterium]